MLEIAFTVEDLARTRFAVSPLWEVIASIRILKRRPGSLHRPWLAAVEPRLRGAGPGVGLLFDLVQPASWYVPDFLSPPPRSPVPDLTAEITALRGLDTEVVRADLDVLAHASTSPAGSLDGASRPGRGGDSAALPTDRVRALYDDPPAGLGILADGIEAYWALAIGPYWGRIRALLDGDLLFRGRQLGTGGHAELFGDLAPAVSWRDGTLRIRHRRFSGRRRLDGEGLLLVPSAFVWPEVFSSTIPPWQPSLTYPARGVATLWQPTARDPSEPVARVLGRSRARLLAQLASPTSTTELAHRTGLSTGAVSQHLGAMHDAGLVTAHRVGRSVLYARTALAESLLAGG